MWKKEGDGMNQHEPSRSAGPHYFFAFFVLALACLFYLQLDMTGYLTATTQIQYLKTIDADFTANSIRILSLAGEPSSILATGSVRNGDAIIVVTKANGEQLIVIDTHEVAEDEEGIKKFDRACEETCSLTLTEKNLEIRYILEPKAGEEEKQVLLHMDNMVYTTYESISENIPPVWISKKTSFLLAQGQTWTMKLDDYFGYEDRRIEKELTYLATASPNLNIDLIQ